MYLLHDNNFIKQEPMADRESLPVDGLSGIPAPEY
jgi:hypothetical protein